MKNWKEIEIPDLIKNNCKLDKRGLPVPYVVLEFNGEHFFKVNDSNKQLDCIKNNKCSICGTGLKEKELWMIGGPRSALHKHGVYLDSPVHYECGTYALRVCPYLAYSKYDSTKTDIEKLGLKVNKNKKEEDKEVLLVNLTVDLNKVPLFVFAQTENISYNSINKYITPERPFKKIEFWKDGEKLDMINGLFILSEYAKKYYEIYNKDYL